MATRSFAAAGASALATGCTATEYGRNWFLITGVVALNSDVLADSAGPNACANGSNAFSVGVLAFANACTLPSVRVVCCSVPGSSVSACSRFWSCEEIAAKFGWTS